jgi:hypothetical protein
MNDITAGDTVETINGVARVTYVRNTTPGYYVYETTCGVFTREEIELLEKV